jgi:MSHA biogenesis protein MshP
MSKQPSPATWPSRKPRGFALVSAIFILVVLAALGAAILVVSTTQQVGSALDVQGSRVYRAARAGIEWGVYKRTRDNVPCTVFPGVPPNVSFTFPTAPTLAGITVTVTCTDYTDASSTPPIHVYEIRSTACNQPLAGNCPNTSPGPNYIERRLKATL